MFFSYANYRECYEYIGTPFAKIRKFSDIFNMEKVYYLKINGLR